MKKAVSFVLILALIICTSVYSFSTNEHTVSAADKLYALGLFSGTGKDDNGAPIYDLDRLMNRQEAITMYVNMLGKAPEAMKGSWTIPFKDVDSWATPFVGYAYENGLTAGFSETQFGSRYTITTTQYLTYLLLSLGYESGTDFVWNDAVTLADTINLTNGTYSNTDNLTRGDVVVLSESALRTKLKDQDVLLADQLIAAGVFTQETWDEVYSTEKEDDSPSSGDTLKKDLWSSHYDKAFYDKIASEYASSYKSEETALILSTPEQLAAFAAFTNASSSNTFLNKFVALDRDISLKGYEWVPISMPEFSADETDENLRFYRGGGFSGTFIGNGYTVSDLTIDRSTESLVGFFGAIQNNSIVSNLNVTGFINGNWNIGGIAAYNMGGTIRNCKTNITIHTIGLCAGGISGQCSGGVISGCTTEGSITGPKESGNLGGIVGWIGYSTVEDCRNSGAVIGGYRIGGIAGRLSDEGKIISCENNGEVTSLWYGGDSVAGVADGEDCEIIDSR